MLSTLRVQLRGELTDADLKQTINNCQRQIVEGHRWSWTLGNAVINSQAPKTLGLVTLATGSSQVLGQGCGFTPNDVGSFLWISNFNLAPCPVMDVQGSNALTLFTPWPGPTMQLIGYTLAPLYYAVEGALEVRMVRNQQPLEKRTREEVNAADPARISFGGAPASIWCEAPYAESGALQIELWPVPQDARWYLCDIKRAAPKLIRDTDHPLCPSSVLEAKALRDACYAAYAGSGNMQWYQLGQTYEAQFNMEWESQQISDSAKMRHLKQTDPPRQIPYPFDAAYTPTHNQY